ncbi:MAG: threonylcarbamoyl-AMP synthase [Rhodobacteraceae bacterium]|nr:threonylcarbamoyl-AMP synthase [Paracoccaceae bacterium]
MTQRLAPDQVKKAAAIVQAGGLVAFATETVYGLGADATNGKAVERIYKAKGRPPCNPLIVHVASFEAARQIAAFNEAAHILARAFWPGPLTLILPMRAGAGLSGRVTAGLPDVAVRIPAHGVALDLIRAAGCPLAAPSANPSGRVSATTADHVLAGLRGRIDAVIDCGACRVGLESTIVAAGDPVVTLARQGGVPVEVLESTLGHPIPPATSPDQVVSPGQMLSHYAPKSPLRLNAGGRRAGESLLGFGPTPGAIFNLSSSGNLCEAAANLFAHLRALDAIGQPIAVVPIPEVGLGAAINDRLRRAAA